jgi:hypothetical protein
LVQLRHGGEQSVGIAAQQVAGFLEGGELPATSAPGRLALVARDDHRLVIAVHAVDRGGEVSL